MMRPGPRAAIAARPAAPGTAQHPHEDRLGLVVGMVRDRDVIRSDAIGGRIQKSVAGLARALLEIWHFSRKPIRALNDEIDLASSTQLAHESLIAIGFRAPNRMIEMRRDDAIAKALAHRAEDMKERDRIRPSRKRDENSRLASNSHSGQADSNRAQEAFLGVRMLHLQSFWFPFHFRGRG